MKRKFLTAIPVAILAGTMAVGMMGSAISNPRDPNGDGYIGLNDAVYIHQFLYGSTIPSNLTPLDFDQNGIISFADRDKVQKYCLNLTTVPDQSSNDPIESFTGKRLYYRRHKYSNNTNYSYSIRTETTSASAQTRSIIPPNDMIRDYDTAVVRLTGNGSGFIVGDHLVMTAAQCVTNQNTQEFYDITMEIVGNDNSVIATYSPKYAHVPTSYYQRLNGNDYALLYFEEDLSQYGKFELACPLDAYADNSGPVIVSGFPQEYPDSYQSANSGIRFKAVGNITGSSRYDELRYDADMDNGDIGGPVYVEEGIYNEIELMEYKSVIGINSNDIQFVNYATKINPDIISFVHSNSYIIP